MANITNEMIYKTAEERVRAFVAYCNNKKECDHDSVRRDCPKLKCMMEWLALEADEEKPENCPFCGGETHNNLGHLKAGVVHYWVDCISPDCMYRSAHYTDEADAIAAHNRVARAVRAAREGEAK